MSVLLVEADAGNSPMICPRNASRKLGEGGLVKISNAADGGGRNIDRGEAYGIRDGSSAADAVGEEGGSMLNSGIVMEDGIVPSTLRFPPIVLLNRYEKKHEPSVILYQGTE